MHKDFSFYWMSDFILRILERAAHRNSFNFLDHTVRKSFFFRIENFHLLTPYQFVKVFENALPHNKNKVRFWQGEDIPEGRPNSFSGQFQRTDFIHDQDISPSPILADLHELIKHQLIDDMYNYAMSITEDSEEMLVHTLDVTMALGASTVISNVTPDTPLAVVNTGGASASLVSGPVPPNVTVTPAGTNIVYRYEIVPGSMPGSVTFSGGASAACAPRQD